jgi:hypothetical protein
MESGAQQRATNAKNLPKPITVALGTKNKIAQNQEELLKWIKQLTP